MKWKSDLDVEVAASLGVPVKKVAPITTALLDEIRRSLIEDGAVHLTGLGRLGLHFGAGNGSLSVGPEVMARVARVSFAKSRMFREQIKKHFNIKTEGNIVQQLKDRRRNEQVCSG